VSKTTKAQRDELRLRIDAAITTVCKGMAAMSIPANPRDVDLVLADCAKALDDLDAAEAERDKCCDDYQREAARAVAAEAERDEAVALIDAAKSDVRPESFLEHAQAILAKCIAPYSCEQMKAVGDALAGCYRKWELMSEVALKAKEDADAMAKWRDHAVAERDATEAALREVCDKLAIGEAMQFPDGTRNSCDIFHALLDMHGLWREPTGGES
jgi:hypothetical protein